MAYKKKRSTTKLFATNIVGEPPPTMPRTKTMPTVLKKTLVADSSAKRCRYWCFTLNNYNDNDIMRLKLYAAEKCRYMVFGREKGEAGTEHLQGYMQLPKATQGQTIKNQSKVLNMWMEPTNGNGTSARDYCLKEDKQAYQFGNFIDHPPTSKRGSAAGNKASTCMWTSLNNKINAGQTEKEIKDLFPHIYYKHQSGIAAGIRCANAIPPRRAKTCVHVLVGPPGCGKTSKAMELAGQDPYLYSSPNKIWWSGYDGTAPVIIDDFHGNYPFGDWKQMTDMYPHKVPIHCGLINFNPKLLIITSNLDPSEWWKPEVVGRQGLAALYRRINVLEVWNEEEQKFINVIDPVEGYFRSLWDKGCLCPQEVQTPDQPTLELESPPLQVTPSPKLKRQTAVLLDDLLENSEFPMEDFPFLPLSKRQKIQKGLLNKSVPSLVVTSPIEDPIVVESESDEDDDDDMSDSDPFPNRSPSLASDSLVSDSEEEESEPSSSVQFD